MATTMREVAEAAGVSIATVSFVVNNSKRVAPETRERIERVMAELGFRRNVVARALASRRTRIIALVYPMLAHRLAGSVTEFITSAARAASAAGYHLVVWPVGNDGSELAALVGEKLVDGVLLMEVQLDDARVAALRELDIPFALIGRTRDVTGLHYVDIDFDASVQMAMDHLAELGHDRIVLVNGSQEGESFASYGPYVRSEIAYREAVRTARDRARGPALPADSALRARRRDGAGGDRAGHHRRDHRRRGCVRRPGGRAGPDRLGGARRYLGHVGLELARHGGDVQSAVDHGDRARHRARFARRRGPAASAGRRHTDDACAPHRCAGPWRVDRSDSQAFHVT